MDKRAAIFTTALVALGAGAGFLWHRLQTARAQASVQATPDLAVPANSAPAAEVATAPGPAGVPRVPVRPADSARPDVARVAASPAYLQKHAAIRATLTELYPELATELQLTPEEAGRFLDLLAGQQIMISELTEERRGDRPRDLERLIRHLQKAGEAEQAGMLGGKYQEWQRYQEAELERDPVELLHNTLVRRGGGLGPELMGPLGQAIIEEQKRLESELLDVPGARGSEPRELLRLQVERAASSNRRLVETASRYLHPQQLEIYEQLLQRQAAGMQKKLRSMENEE